MDGLEFIIGYAIIYQLAILVVPIFKLVIAIVAAKHFKGIAILLMLVGAIGGLILHFISLYFDYYYLPRYHSSPNFEYFLYGRTVANIVISLAYLVGVYLLIKQWIKERQKLINVPHSIKN